MGEFCRVGKTKSGPLQAPGFANLQTPPEEGWGSGVISSHLKPACRVGCVWKAQPTRRACPEARPTTPLARLGCHPWLLA